MVMPGTVTDNGRPAASTTVVVSRPRGLVLVQVREGTSNIRSQLFPFRVVVSVTVVTLLPVRATLLDMLRVCLLPDGNAVTTDNVGASMPNCGSEIGVEVVFVPSGAVVVVTPLAENCSVLDNVSGPVFWREKLPSGVDFV